MVANSGFVRDGAAARSRQWKLVASAVAIVASPGPAFAQDATIDNGMVVSVPSAGQPSPWTIGGTLSVGDLSDGTVSIDAGGKVSSAFGYLGVNPGSTGSVTIAGAGSEWINAGPVIVGYAGTGTLSITNGAVLESRWNQTGTGTSATLPPRPSSGAPRVLVENIVFPPGMATNESILLREFNLPADNRFVRDAIVEARRRMERLGYVRNVDVTTASGSDVDKVVINISFGEVPANEIVGPSGYIGYAAGSVGDVTVTGPGAQWNNNGWLSIGERGTGSLTISDGGMVTSAHAYIGYEVGSEGRVLVTGQGSEWRAGGNINVGDYGTGSLTVQNGGKVNVGDGAGGTGNGVINVAVQDLSSGTVNIGAASGAPAAAAGVIEAAEIRFGAGDGSLIFNHTGTSNFAPMITGGGEVRHESGTTLLTAQNTYTGATTVDGGTLLVNGSIESSSLTTVNAGATLGGTGTVGHTAINGGTLAPTGVLNVNGNLSFTADSTYRVEVPPGAILFGAGVNGNATLGGAQVNVVFAPGSYIEKVYTILASTNLIGAFGGVTTNANLTASLVNNANSVDLHLAFGFTPPPSGFNANQQQVATTLGNYFDAHDGIAATFGVLSARELSQASGETATGAPQAAFDAQNQFMNVLTDPFAAGRAGPSSSPALGYAAAEPPRSQAVRDAYAALYPKAPPPPAGSFDSRWRVFGAAYGGNAMISGNAALGSHQSTARIYGGVGGVDYLASPDTTLGFAFGGGGTSFALADGLGSGRSDLFQAGLHARHTIAGAGYLSGALGYGRHDVSTDRTAPTGERLRSQYKANVLSGRIEAGWRVATAYAGVTPYAAAQAISYRLPAYAEQGAGGPDSFALAYAGRDVTATRSEFGFRFDRAMVLDGALLTLRGRAAWAHNFDTARELAASFQALPGTGFLVNGAAQAPDAALVSAGADIAWRGGYSLGVFFDSEFSDTTTSYAGRGRLKLDL